MASILSADEKAVHEALCQIAFGVSDGEWRSVDLAALPEKLPNMSEPARRRAMSGLATTGFYRSCTDQFGRPYGQVRDAAFQVVA